MKLFRSWVAATLAAFLFSTNIAIAQQADAPEPSGAHAAVHGHRTGIAHGTVASTEVCSACIRANLDFLAGPQLHGRGSGTEDEHHAAEFIARMLKEYGLQPAASEDQYIQTVTIESRTVQGTPTLSLQATGVANAGATVWAHGKDIALINLPQADVSGPLQKLDLSDPSITPSSVKEGAAVALKFKAGLSPEELQKLAHPFSESKAAIVILPVSPETEGIFKSVGAHPPHTPKKIGSDEPAQRPTRLLADRAAFEHIWNSPDGSMLRVQGKLSPWQEGHTWNVLARLNGEDSEHIVLLSAHMDHLGVVKGKTYPGADDDGSGTVAVMELARALAKGPKPRRTVVFALWGSEEAGMIGSQYWLQHPTFALQDIVANLEFEMIARPDPQVKPDQLWLTGWDRTDLGPQLAQHGANLVADPHPDQNFFARSDNYALDQKGIVAQTVSSFGLHKDYHEPTDTLSRVSWSHLDAAIASMIEPVSWLVNSDFVPQWKDGGKP